jgi:hypothetical protein
VGGIFPSLSGDGNGSRPRRLGGSGGEEQAWFSVGSRASCRPMLLREFRTGGGQSPLPLIAPKVENRPQFFKVCQSLSSRAKRTREAIVVSPQIPKL